MSAYDLQELLKLWTAERITMEQATGQILLQIELLAERVGVLERRLEELRRASATRGAPRGKR